MDLDPRLHLGSRARLVGPHRESGETIALAIPAAPHPRAREDVPGTRRRDHARRHIELIASPARGHYRRLPRGRPPARPRRNRACRRGCGRRRPSEPRPAPMERSPLRRRRFDAGVERTARAISRGSAGTREAHAPARSGRTPRRQSRRTPTNQAWPIHPATGTRERRRAGARWSSRSDARGLVAGRGGQHEAGVLRVPIMSEVRRRDDPGAPRRKRPARRRGGAGLQEVAPTSRRSRGRAVRRVPISDAVGPGT